MRVCLAILGLAGLLAGATRTLTQMTVTPGKRVMSEVAVEAPSAGDWIDILTSRPQVLVAIVLPDGRRIEDGRPGGDELALRSAADMGVRYDLDSKKLLGVEQGRHHILALSRKLPAGKYQVSLDLQERGSAAHVTLALVPAADVKEVRKQSGRDSIFLQRVELAAEARDWKDTAEELKQLLPAFEYAIQSRSLESVESVAQSLNRAYCDIDQPEKGLTVMQHAAAEVRRIAGAESIAAAEFEVEVATTLLGLGKLTAAQALVNAAVGKVRKAAGPDSVVLEDVLAEKGLLDAMAAGNETPLSEASKEVEAIEKRRQHKSDFGFPPDSRIDELLEQAKAASAKNGSAEMDQLIAAVLDRAEKLDINNPQRSRAWWEAAIVYNSPSNRRPELVDKYLMKALTLSEAALGGRRISDVMRLSLPILHLQRFSAAVYTLEGSCGKPGRAFDCVALRERSNSVYEQALGPDHPVVGAGLGALAELLFFTATQDRLKKPDRGVNDRERDPRIDRALAYRRRELSIYEMAFGKDDPWLADTIEKLAEIYRYEKNEAMAQQLNSRAADLRDKGLPAHSEEDLLKRQVRQLRLLLRFDEADNIMEAYRTRHPGTTLLDQ